MPERYCVPTAAEPPRQRHFPKADAAGFETHANDLGMAGVAIADLLIGRLGHMAVGVARFDRRDAIDPLVHGFQAPEATATEGDGVDRCAHAVSPWDSG
jgi:hypothetical protein